MSDGRDFQAALQSPLWHALDFRRFQGSVYSLPVQNPKAKIPLETREEHS